MDNLGDWLYIIFLVVAGVSGLVSSGKKKRLRQEEQQRREVFEEEGELFPEILDFPPIPEPEPVREKKVRPIPVPIRTQTVVRPIVAADRKAVHFEEEEAVSPVTAEEFHDPDALRKAVIYAEIFNRKY
jgi:hypothetical protein